MTDTVYSLNGAYEDWAYAAGNIFYITSLYNKVGNRNLLKNNAEIKNTNINKMA